MVLVKDFVSCLVLLMMCIRNDMNEMDIGYIFSWKAPKHRRLSFA